MPNPSTQIIFVASSLALYVHALAGLACVVLVFLVAGTWLAVPAIILMAGLINHQHRIRPGQLRREASQSAAQWHWRQQSDSEWQTVAVSCDYLGPWLIGLKVDGHRLWVWPDSSDAASHRMLRRWLVTLP